MNKEENDRITLILFIVVIILILIILGILIFRGKKLDPSSEVVTKIYQYTGSNDLDLCGGLFVYNDSKVDYDSLDNSTRICLAYSLLGSDKTDVLKVDTAKKNNNCSINDDIVFAVDTDENKLCTVTKVDAKLLNDKYKEIYNHEIDTYDTFNLDNTTICYYADDAYYCGNNAGEITYTIGAEPKTYRTINRVFEKGSRIIIYDYFLKIINEDCYSYYTKEDNNLNCTNNYKATIFNDGNEKEQSKFLKKYGTKYKHVYEKVGDTYYWVESVPL